MTDSVKGSDWNHFLPYPVEVRRGRGFEASYRGCARLTDAEARPRCPWYSEPRLVRLSSSVELLGALSSPLLWLEWLQITGVRGGGGQQA